MLVQVHLFVVLVGHVACLEPGQRVVRHDASGHSFVAGALQFLHRPNAPFFRTIFCPPDGQWNAPETGTAQIPIVDIFQPLAKPARSSAFRLPRDGVVQGHHPLLRIRGANEPRIEWIIEDGLVSAPAVGIAVLVLFHLEGLATFLQKNGDLHVKWFGVLLRVHIKFRFHVSSCKWTDTETSLKVHQGHPMSVPIVHEHCRHSSILGHAGIVGAKRWGRMDHARAVLCGDKIPGDDLKGSLRILHGGRPVKQGFIAHAHQIGPLHSPHHFVVWGLLVAPLLGDQGLCEHHETGRFSVAVGGAHHGVGNVRAHRQCRVGRQGPWGRRPSQKVQRLLHSRASHELEHLFTCGGCGAELRNDGGVFDVPVGARLIELMRAQSGPCHGAVWLDRIAFVKLALLMQLGQKPPNRFHVLGLVGDVRGFHVHPVPHLTGQFVPLRGVTHDGFAACIVVLLDREFGPDVFFRDPQFLFHPQLDRQAMGVPASLAFHPVAFEGLETTENVLDGPCHHMVNAGFAIRRGRALKEDVRLVRRA